MHRRPIVVWCGLFVVGIAAEGAVRLSPGPWLACIGLLAVAATGITVRGRTPPIVVAVLLIAWGGWWCATGHARLVDTLDAFIENGPVLIRGTIVSHPEKTDDRQTFVVRVRDIGRQDVVKHSAARVRVIVVDGPAVSYGDAVEIRGELRRPSPATNPGAFNYRDYLHRQGVTATVFVAHARHVTVTGVRFGNPLMLAAATLRDAVRRGLNGALSPETSAVAAAVVLGDRQQLSPDTEEQFRRAGVSHLLAVSGLHVGFFSMTGFWLLRAMRLPPWLSAVVAVTLSWTYVLATGARPPAVRAGVMATFALTAAGLGRRRDTVTALFAGAWCLLVHNPLLLFDVSFQLSFAATAAIVVGFAPMARRLSWLPRPVASATAATATAQIGVLPLLAGTFQQLSVVGFGGSLVGSPVVALLIPVGVAAGLAHHVSTMLGAWLGAATATLVSILLTITDGLAALPWAFIDVPAPTMAVSVAWWVVWWAVAASTLPARRRRMAVLAAVALAALSLWASVVRTATTPDLFMMMMDVGQGDAIVIRTRDGVTALVDGGGNIFSDGESRANPGENIILPYLRHAGIDAVDVVINSHPHEDHLQGLLPVMAARRVGLAVDGGQVADGPSWPEYVSIIEEQEIVRWIARPGHVIRLGSDTVLEVLHPAALLTGTRSDLNNNSVVLRVVYRNTAALLTGDIEMEAQLELLHRGPMLDAQVLKVPHHGSRLALVSAFYEAVNPDIAVITVGRNNYGHPSAEVIEALEVRGATVYRTDIDGAVQLTSDGTRWAVRTMVPAR